MPADFQFTVEPPFSNQPFVVDITAAPCPTVTVEFSVGGVVISTVTVKVPGSTTFTCPAGSSGKTWDVSVECPDGLWSAKGGSIS